MVAILWKKNKIISFVKGNLRCGKEVMYGEISVINILPVK